ncbi:MAG: methylmalonyl-CoA mutase family protein [Candidatus Kapabacteria bacterium]|nr:methylmalonyl-CoA mutase family protein [Candidatus Kapabacteria bacterium]MDW8225592.1 methylmalonyl-CoA mutase family protein [Bacteroidota bacterium]
MAERTPPYRPQYRIRIVTAASLFDGHDAAINIMRRIMQATGAEVIHLGHNRSAREIVEAAIQEYSQGVAVTSYQGGHMEFFTYMYDLLRERGAGHIKVFGGGGGTILPSEIQELHRYGIARIYHPDDGRIMGLQGMINDVLQKCDFLPPLTYNGDLLSFVLQGDPLAVAQAITLVEEYPEQAPDFLQELRRHLPPRCIPVLGITGTGGSGKSSLTDELVRRFLLDYPNKRVAILSVDPSKRRSGGALLGDRIRINMATHPRIYMRSFATREANVALNRNVRAAIDIVKAAGVDLVIVETAGIGQSDTSVVDIADVTLYVMTPDYGAPSQLEKIDMIDYADLIAINKFDRFGAQDALRDVRKQYQRSHGLWGQPLENMPVVGTIASQFNDPGVNALYALLIRTIAEKVKLDWRPHLDLRYELTRKIEIIPPNRRGYLGEIAETVEQYNRFVEEQATLASRLYQLHGALEHARQKGHETGELEREFAELWEQLDPQCRHILQTWEEKLQRYRQPEFSYMVRGSEIRVPNFTESLSHLKIPKIASPRYRDWGDILRWALQENFPGEFPYTAGVYPFKRQSEDPTRMFAGEGTPERTNRRFHYLSHGMPAARLSTAFDSVTLYGEDPDHRPDIYGKVGNSGVSIATVDDAKKLYSGFDLCAPNTSVSMTINGPAPMILAMFFNAAIDQQCEKHILQEGLREEVERRIEEMYATKGLPRPVYQGELPEGHNGLGLLLLGVSGDEVLPREVYENIKAETLRVVRGTVQADILKEDQAQNTCIFSTEFALRLMGDVQEYFVRKRIRNFYSVSISGYHIAEAGANPITQLALTLANAFTYAEYFLSRGMHIDEFAPNLSFFFSNGMDPEYTVIGRVARRIWAKVIRYKYGGNERSQMLKYHIQTSGRSLHAQEIAFNDIRTTLQALYAIADNCNSLHTNAYDEAITTPTEESVRRAVAIQLIINKELGLTKNENPWQGSFFIEQLTDAVEQAVLEEFRRLNERGGVLGAMELMYQRAKIQEESLHYEQLKHSGELPIIGVNTFLDKHGSPTIVPEKVVRSTQEEKEQQIANLRAFWQRNAERAPAALERVRQAAIRGENVFEELMEAVKVCSLGQLTHALYEVGGQYRRNM